MSTYQCQPVTKPLDATVTLPGSKSITNRALIAAALADGTSLLKNVLLADDTRIMIEVLRGLGIAITIDEAECAAEVTGCQGQIPASSAELLCGNSGTTMRFCTALTALGHGQYQLDGIERMRQRPIGQLVKVLQALGVGIEYVGNEGFPPITVHAGGLRGGQVSFHSPPSSQFVSALLLAAPHATRDLLVEVTGEVPSTPYLKTTTAVMESFGVAVIEQYREQDIRFIVEAPQRYQGATLTIEPDASNAMYFLAAPAVAGGSVTVEGLGTNSIQGDVRFLDLLERIGCRIKRHPTRLSVTGPPAGEQLRGIEVDLNEMPDVVPTLAVIALFAQGPTAIRNIGSLRLKETDRITALGRELGKLGAKVDESTDSLSIHPPARITPAEIETYDDHRIAMSFAIAGLKCRGIAIRNPGCCAKTFPGFFALLEHITRRAS